MINCIPNSYQVLYKESNYLQIKTYNSQNKVIIMNIYKIHQLKNKILIIAKVYQNLLIYLIRIMEQINQ